MGQVAGQEWRACRAECQQCFLSPGGDCQDASASWQLALLRDSWQGRCATHCQRALLGRGKLAMSVGRVIERGRRRMGQVAGQEWCACRATVATVASVASAHVDARSTFSAWRVAFRAWRRAGTTFIAWRGAYRAWRPARTTFSAWRGAFKAGEAPECTAV